MFVVGPGLLRAISKAIAHFLILLCMRRMQAKRRIYSPLHWLQCFATTMGMVEGWFVTSFNWIFQILLLGFRTLQTSAVRKGRLWLAVCCARKTIRQRLANSRHSSKRNVAFARAWDGESQSTEGIEFRCAPETQKAPNLGLDTLNADIGTLSMMQLGYERRTTRLECSEVENSSRVPHGRARV